MQGIVKVVVFIVVASVDSRPIMWAESPEELILQDFENYILDPKELKEYVSTSQPSISRIDKIASSKDESFRNSPVKLDNQTLRTVGKLMRQGLTLRNALEEIAKNSTIALETTSMIYVEEILPTTPETSTLPNKRDRISKNETLPPETTTGNGQPLRQEASEENGEKLDSPTLEDGDEREARQESSEESDEDDEGGGGVGGLISAFLSGLSKPDGGVDVDAIAALIGSLSTQNDDGSYDFSGLTELLMSFFGGDDEGGGGSDIGRFLGGLVGAFIKGVAQPPGARGAGIFAGKVVGEILPVLSSPDGTESPEGQPPPKDSAGFLSGLLSTILGSSSGGQGNNGGGGSKFSIVKSVIGLFTSVLTSSSSSSSKKAW